MKKVRIVRAGNGLYIKRIREGVYGLTILKYATRFDTSKEMNIAIKYCKDHSFAGEYNYIRVREKAT